MREARLIVNADDLGMSRGITDGIILAHRYGFVTSASLMVNMPAAEYAVSRLATAPRLGVGVHLNITAGRPLLSPSAVPTLVDASGKFHGAAVMSRKLLRWTAAAAEIEAEFRAQIRWMKERGRGPTPTHADSHQHMHIYLAAIRPFIRALSAEGIPCTRAPRSVAWPEKSESGFDSMGGPHAGSLGRRLSVQLYRGLLQAVAFRRFGMPDSRVSFLSRDRDNLDLLGARWKSTFANLPGGIFELACHPGLFERGFSESDPIRLLREEELHWLTDRDWRDALDRSGIRLISYRELATRESASHVSGAATAAARALR